MCPNCVLNQAPLQGGLYVAFGICFLFFIIGIAGVIWAFKNGEFEDMEGTKFDMMDDDLDGANAARARALVERARARQASEAQ